VRANISGKHDVRAPTAACRRSGSPQVPPAIVLGMTRSPSARLAARAAVAACRCGSRAPAGSLGGRLWVLGGRDASGRVHDQAWALAR
jgi:hypothetical protein